MGFAVNIYVIPVLAAHVDVIIVTGASKGIGLATAKHLQQCNYNIVATARHPDDLSSLKQLGFVTHHLELQDPDSISAFAAWIKNSAYEVKALVNNAGALVWGPLLVLPEEQWTTLFEVNVFAPLRLIRPLLNNLSRNRAKIIMLSSDAGLHTAPWLTLYSMTKHAVEAMTDGLAAELQHFGITVHAIEPGNVDTTILQTASTQLPDPDTVDAPLREYYVSTREQLQQTMETYDPQTTPGQVAQVVGSCVESKTPLRRYLVVDPSEQSYIINELFDRIVQLNQSTEKPYSQEDLMNKLEFSLNV